MTDWRDMHTHSYGRMYMWWKESTALWMHSHPYEGEHEHRDYLELERILYAKEGEQARAKAEE